MPNTPVKTISSWLLPLFFMLLLGVSACRSTKEATEGRKAKPDKVLESCKNHNLQFTTMSLSGRGKADVPGQDVSIGMSYRINILADSLILIRVTKLGIEGIRALITRDSVFVLNRLDQTVRISGLSAAKKITGLDADFELVQALILGNFYQMPDNLIFQKRKSNPHQVYTGSKAGTDFQYEIDASQSKLARMEAFNLERNQHTHITYSGFQNEQEQVIPTEGELQVLAPEPAVISFRHTKVQFDEGKVSFKFNIPSGYERIVE